MALAEYHHPREIRRADLFIDFSDQLGEGGFGEVFRGEWMNTPVAVKRLTNLGTRSRRPEMFEREVEKWAQLIHPNVLPFLGFAREEQNRYMVSPMMKYGCVRDYLEDFEDADRMALIYNVAAAMRYLHAMDCIHADMKPDNVLVNAGKEAVVSDFGAAKLRVGKFNTTHGIRAGTERYMPPERVHNRRVEVTKAMDVYSFGMTAYEIWTEDPPFSEHGEGFKLNAQIAEGRREFLRIVPDMPDQLRILLWSCTDPNPSRRPSMAEVTDVLKKISKHCTPSPVSFWKANPALKAERFSRSYLSKPDPDAAGPADPPSAPAADPPAADPILPSFSQQLRLAESDLHTIPDPDTSRGTVRHGLQAVPGVSGNSTEQQDGGADNDMVFDQWTQESGAAPSHYEDAMDRDPMSPDSPQPPHPPNPFNPAHVAPLDPVPNDPMPDDPSESSAHEDDVDYNPEEEARRRRPAGKAASPMKNRLRPRPNGNAKSPLELRPPPPPKAAKAKSPTRPPRPKTPPLGRAPAQPPAQAVGGNGRPRREAAGRARGK